MTEIHMPRLSDTMEEGVLAGWRKQIGEKVQRGEIVAEIETDKALMELEAYDDGVLEKLLVGEGETVPIGTPIALLGDGSGATAEAAEAAPATAASAAAESDPAPAPVETASPSPTAAVNGSSGNGSSGDGSGGTKPKASPLAKAIAREHGLDLTAIAGTGPGGRIIRADIDAELAKVPQSQPEPAATASAPAAAAASTPVAANEDVEEIPLSKIRKITAKRLTESKQQAPHFYLTSAIDVTDLIEFRGNLNERLQSAGGTKVSLNDLVVKACATALRTNPSVNVSFADDKLLQHRRIHLGVAVALDDGLVVPVIPDADRKSVSEIATEGREKAGRAREGKLKPDEMSGSTFSVSNLGMFGIEEFAAVINPPEAAILAVGATRDEVQHRDGEFVVRKIMRVTLSADHRAVDGAVGAVFLQQLTGLLEDPIRIIA